MANQEGYQFGLDGNGFPRQYGDGLIGQAWVDDGYPISPGFNEVDDCPVCGAAMTTCTDATHRAGMAYQEALNAAQDGE